MIGLSCLVLALYWYIGPKRYLSVFLLFFLATAGFQMVPVNLITLPRMGISKAYDWVLLFAAIVFFFQPKILAVSPIWKHFKILIVFGLILVILFCYSIFIRDIEVEVSVRVFRNFIIFIVLFLFIPLQLSDYKKIFQLIIYATSIASFLYCMQLVLQTSLLNKVTSDLSAGEGAEVITRYYNVPVFVYPVIFFLFYLKHVFYIKYRTILLCINVLAVLCTQHRNLIVAVALCYFLFLVMNNRMKIQYAVVYLLIGGGLFVGADSLMNQRFSKGFENISRLSLNTSDVNFRNVSLSDLTTTEFRKLIFVERLDFILKDETRSVFGIGLITDDSQKAKALKFYIGVPDDDGNISQISNVDIVWASMLLQLGISGTLIFVLVYLSLFKKIYVQRTDSYMQVGMLYLVTLFITSFYGSMIAMPYVTCLVMLFAAYCYHLSRISAEV